MRDKSVSSKRKLDFMEMFPDEINLEILGYLDANDLEKAELVGPRWYAIARDWWLWRRLAYQQFTQSALEMPVIYVAYNSKYDWYDIYHFSVLINHSPYRENTGPRLLYMLMRYRSYRHNTNGDHNLFSVVVLAYALKRPECKLRQLSIDEDLPTNYARLIFDTLRNENCLLQSLDIRLHASLHQIYEMIKTLKHPNCSLEYLTLRKMKFGNTRARIFADAIASPHFRLTEIKFVDCDFTVNGGGSIADAVVHADYFYHRTIKLSGHRRLSQMIESVQSTMTLVDQGETELVLWKSNISLTQLIIIADKLTKNARETTSINLGNNQIDDMGAQVIADLIIQENCSLRTVMLHYNRIGLVGIKAIAKSLKHPQCKLESLNLLKNNITKEGILALAEAVVCAKLINGRRVMIKGVPDINKVIRDIEKPIKNLVDPLTILSFWGSKLNDIHARIIAARLVAPQCKLKELNLGWNSITDEGARALADAIKHSNCSLQMLNIQHNCMGLDGYRALIEACFYAKEHYGREIEIKGLQGATKKLLSARAKKSFQQRLYRRNWNIPYRSRVFKII